MKILQKEDYVKILQNRFDTKDIEFIDSSWAPLSENIEGFMGDHYILKITYKTGNDEQTENFFVKTKPRQSEFQIEIVSTLNPYEKEIFLYGYLFKEFQKLSYNTSFAPKSYYCKNYETIVMEDLKINGFILFKRGECYDLDHCKAALLALAYYHGNSIVYEEQKSTELGKPYRINKEYPELFNEIFYIPGDIDGIGVKFIKSALDCMESLCDVMPESSGWKETCVQKIQNFDHVKMFWKDLPGRKTCGHGDLWSNNMLFKYTNGIPSSCCLVDFQGLRYFHPGFDVMLLIHSNCRRDFRKKHLDELLQYYYQSFAEILRSHSLEPEKILNVDQFLEGAKAVESVAILQAVSGRTFLFLPMEVTNDAVTSGGSNLEDLFLINRSDMLLKVFENDDKIRNIFMDDIRDIYEHF